MKKPPQAEVAWGGSLMLTFKVGATDRAKLQAHSNLSHCLASCSRPLGEVQDISFLRGQDVDTAGCGG